VKWWNTLHQGSSINFTSSPTMAAIMLKGMLIMALGFWLYSAAVILMRVRREIEDRERNTAWLNEFKE
jgi:heme exporter protein C